MKRLVHFSINFSFFIAVIVIASTIAFLALIKKVDQNTSQYNHGLKGTVVKQTVPVLALSQGAVKKVYVHLGDDVKKNELLVELENPVLRGKIEALKQYPDNVSAQTEAKVAEEEMKGWKLYSPVNGVITNIVVNEGAPVQVLAKVLEIYSNDNIMLLAYLSNEQYAAIQQQKSITAYSERLQQSFILSPNILQPDEKTDNFNEKKIGLYFKFKDYQEAQSLLNNEDLSLNIAQSSNKVAKPIDYLLSGWHSLVHAKSK